VLRLGRGPDIGHYRSTVPAHPLGRGWGCGFVLCWATDSDL